MKVAIIGSGVAGLSAAYHLKHLDITIYEAESHVGGHAWTQEIEGVQVDTGFMVFNQSTYPNMLKWFKDCDVPIEESDMSFAVSRHGLEWSSDSFATFYGQWKSLVNPKFHNMAYQIWCFKSDVETSLRDGVGEMTLGEFLEEKRYGKYFLEYYLLPQVAAIWSCPMESALDFPAIFLFNFFRNHQLLQILDRPQWLTVGNRTANGYIPQVTKGFEDKIRLDSRVVSVEQSGKGKLLITDINNNVEEYDHVIMANHAPDVLRSVNCLSSRQKEILSHFKFEDNDVWLHSDPAMMPEDRKLWASWNCLGDNQLYISYYLNRLQNLETEIPVFITLNPPHEPNPELVANHWRASHPVPTFNSVAAQTDIEDVQGENNLWFAGAYLNYGFHECGFVSGKKVAQQLLSQESDLLPFTERRSLTLFDNVHRRIVLKMISSYFQKGRLEIYEQGGQVKVFGDNSEPSVRITVLSPKFYQAVAYRYDIGLADAYISGHIDCNLLDLFRLLIWNRDSGSSGTSSPFVTWIGQQITFFGHKLRKNSISNTRRNISEHYDLGNDFFELFLDESMSYSCGIYNSPNDSLADAQQNKIDALIEKLNVTENDTVLEIGFGWGALSIELVKQTGCSVVGYTLSSEQKAYAEALVEKEGLSDHIQYYLSDYRTIEGQYSRIVSCEMIEAVGDEYLQLFFSKLDSLLKPNGYLVIQAITIPDDRYYDYINSTDFIQEYIFPGGCLPCHASMASAVEATELTLQSCDEIGVSYAKTLADWLINFSEQKQAVLETEGFDEAFFRTWEYYFLYCQAGFETETLGTCQLVYTK